MEPGRSGPVHGTSDSDGRRSPLNPSAKSAEDVTKFGADTPMKRPAEPEEIAPTYVFFASNADSSYITGEVLALLGGETTAG